MGASHGHALHYHGHSRVHRLAPEAKVAAAFAFVLCVAVTPPTAPWAFGIDLVALVAIAALAGLPARFVVARATIIAPFVAFALLIPFVATGPQVDVVGVAVSREGLVGAFNILAKAVNGIMVSILLTATTEQDRILTGLERLHVPIVLTTIAAFMLRYAALLSGEMGRMRIAMTARGHDPRWFWQARPMATAAGALFVRSYERGERVHAAMLSRGYTGTMPQLHPHPATSRDWLLAGLAPAVAAATAVAALIAT